jgi:hypothetical protein
VIDIKNIGIISSECIHNGLQGKVLHTRPDRDSNRKGGAWNITQGSEPQLPMTQLGDETTCKGFNYWVDCDHIKPRLNSALIFTLTEISEVLFAQLEGCFCLLGAINIV